MSRQGTNTSSDEILDKPRSVLADLSNRLRKRREEFLKTNMNTPDFLDNKRIRLSPHPCTELVNSSTTNVVSSASKTGFPVPNVSIDVDIVSKVTKVCDGDKDFKILDLGGGGNVDRKSCVNEAVKADGCEDVVENAFANVSNSVRENRGKMLSDGKNETDLINLVEANNENADADGASSEDTQSDNNENQNDLLMSQTGSVDCTILPESQESRVVGVEGSAELKKGDQLCVNIGGGGIDSIKACSCSFCTKAAHMWLDLNYQDVKARVSATKKSHKEAIILAERNYLSKGMQQHVAESDQSSTKNLESDLMYQWRSLFLNMAGIWEAEGNHLESRLVQLTDLKEKCKTDLLSINPTSSEKR